MQQAHYEEWKSPLSAEMIAKGAKRYGTLFLEENRVYWEELRPDEKGRISLFCAERGKKPQEVIPAPYSVRTRVYEYGGGAYTVNQGIIYFVNDKDQRIYIKNSLEITPLTEEGIRFADLHFTPFGIVAVGEKGKENFLCLVDVKTGSYTILTSGYDFYASPRWHSKVEKLAWLCWNHPHMPWDGTELWTADFVKGELRNKEQRAGGEKESIFQPEWGPEGALYYVSDRTGWWNLYREGENLIPVEAEFGLPQWVFGMSTYAFAGDKIICSYLENAVGKLGIFDLETGKWSPLRLEETFFSQIRASTNFAAFVAGSPAKPRTIVELDLSSFRLAPISSVEAFPLEEKNISIGVPLAFPSEGGRIAYGFYYPPKNIQYQAIPGEAPPLLVKSHGGPTTFASNVLDLGVQYWTTRGFAVLDVNYGGSTGFGRPYRDSLKGRWGVVDVEDCSYGALYLVKQGWATPQKMAISGGSAGGFTTLCALTFTPTFTVGASYYGVSDLEALAKETHKFEAHYLDQLVAPYPAYKSLYQDRSPINSTDKLSCPVIFFQGAEDKIVPPDQSEKMFAALKKRGIETEFILYPGEQHGFRQKEHIQDALERELKFYLAVFYHNSPY